MNWILFIGIGIFIIGICLVATRVIRCLFKSGFYARTLEIALALFTVIAFFSSIYANILSDYNKDSSLNPVKLFEFPIRQYSPNNSNNPNKIKIDSLGQKYSHNYIFVIDKTLANTIVDADTMWINHIKGSIADSLNPSLTPQIKNLKEYSDVLSLGMLHYLFRKEPQKNNYHIVLYNANAKEKDILKLLPHNNTLDSPVKSYIINDSTGGDKKIANLDSIYGYLSRLCGKNTTKYRRNVVFIFSTLVSEDELSTPEYKKFIKEGNKNKDKDKQMILNLCLLENNEKYIYKSEKDTMPIPEPFTDYLNYSNDKSITYSILKEIHQNNLHQWEIEKLKLKKLESIKQTLEKIENYTDTSKNITFIPFYLWNYHNENSTNISENKPDDSYLNNYRNDSSITYEVLRAIYHDNMRQWEIEKLKLEKIDSIRRTNVNIMGQMEHEIRVRNNKELIQKNKTTMYKNSTYINLYEFKDKYIFSNLRNCVKDKAKRKKYMDIYFSSFVFVPDSIGAIEFYYPFEVGKFSETNHSFIKFSKKGKYGLSIRDESFDKKSQTAMWMNNDTIDNIYLEDGNFNFVEINDTTKYEMNVQNANMSKNIWLEINDDNGKGKVKIKFVQSIPLIVSKVYILANTMTILLLNALFCVFCMLLYHCVSKRYDYSLIFSKEKIRWIIRNFNWIVVFMIHPILPILLLYFYCSDITPIINYWWFLVIVISFLLSFFIYQENRHTKNKCDECLMKLAAEKHCEKAKQGLEERIWI